MALPDYIEKTQGTAIVWGPSGGAGVTASMSLDALANGAAQQGASVDLGANWAQEWVVVEVMAIDRPGGKMPKEQVL